MPGSQNSIFEIFLSCRSHLARAVSHLVPPHEIEDIVQETYVRVCLYKLKKKIRVPQTLMFKIARNLALDHIKRAEWRLTSHAVEDPRTGFGAASLLVDETFIRVKSDEEFAQFCEAVRLLPLQCRRVFILKKVYGYTQQEIAKELNLSESTVEKHVAKGMKLCAFHMLQQDKTVQRPEPGLKQSASRRGGY